MSMHARDCKCCLIYLYYHCSIAIGFGNVCSQLGCCTGSCHCMSPDEKLCVQARRTTQRSTAECQLPLLKEGYIKSLDVAGCCSEAQV